MEAAGIVAEGEAAPQAAQVCTYCKGGLPQGATVCMHCGRETEAARQAKRKERGRRLAWIAGGFVGFVILLVVVGSLNPPADSLTRVTAACAEQYPGDEMGQSRCAMMLMGKMLSDAEANRLRRAEAASR